MDPAALAEVVELGRVLLEVDTMDPNVAEMPASAQRDVVLGDLVGLRVVGIEVVLAVKQRTLSDLAPEGEADHDPELDRPLVDHRQRTREAQAGRAGMR